MKVLDGSEMGMTLRQYIKSLFFTNFFVYYKKPKAI